MSEELEAGALGSVGALKNSGGTKRDRSSTCLNCGTLLHGRFCHVCGQLNDDFQRPFWRLLVEGANDMLAIDSRVLRTIPALIFRPGRVTKNYIDGKRARYVPPFRLYLLASVVFFFLFFAAAPSQDEVAAFIESDDVQSAQSYLIQEAELDGNAIDRSDGEEGAPPDVSEAEEAEDPTSDPSASDDNISINVGGRQVFKNWTDQWQQNARELSEEPRRFWMLVQSWTPRLSLALVPLTVIGLVLVYPFRKGVYLFDHIIAALHFHIFNFIASGIVLLAPKGVQEAGATLFFLALPIYFFRMLLVVYNGSWWLTLIRTFVLWISSFVVLFVLMVALLTTVIATA